MPGRSPRPDPPRISSGKSRRDGLPKAFSFPTPSSPTFCAYCFARPGAKARERLIERVRECFPVPLADPVVTRDADPEEESYLPIVLQAAERKGVELPPGRSDRLLRVENELTRVRSRPFDELWLAEPRDVWPWRWQRVFGLLMGLGVPVRTASVAFDDHRGVPSDLGRVQAALRGNVRSPSAGLQGDRSLVFLRGETVGELAHALASLLRSWNEASTVIVRGGEVRVLDDALVAQGLASTGVVSSSRWRPAGQVLPLALELTFAPRERSFRGASVAAHNRPPDVRGAGIGPGLTRALSPAEA